MVVAVGEVEVSLELLLEDRFERSSNLRAHRKPPGVPTRAENRGRLLVQLAPACYACGKHTPTTTPQAC